MDITLAFGVAMTAMLAIVAWAVSSEERKRKERIIREFGEEQFEAGRLAARKELGFGA